MLIRFGPHSGFSGCLNAPLRKAIVPLLMLVVPAWAWGQSLGTSRAPDPQNVMPVSVDGTTATRSPRIELFAGYSQLPSPDKVKEFSDPGHGVGVSLDVNFSQHVGLVVDFDWHSWTIAARQMGDVSEGPLGIALTYYTVGPRFVVRTNRMAAFGLAAIEGQRSFYGTQSVVDGRIPTGPETATRERSSSAAWGVGFGGGADVSLSDRWAIRAIQVNYSLGGFGSGPGRKLRVKTGVVFKFGQIRGS
jgi:hypothetical protein